MTSRPQIQKLSVREYLEAELRSTDKHEYVAGQIFVMVGVNKTHNLIALNLHTALRSRLRGGRCQIFVSDVKVRVERAEAFYYPDVVVTCDPEEREEYYLSRPCLIIEVLSPATERIDRREKLLAYQQLDSLQEYVLVTQERQQVEIYRRDDRGDWSLNLYTEGQSFRLTSVGVEIDMAAVYEQVPLGI